MNHPARIFIGIALFTVIGAGIGGWVGVKYGLSTSHASGGLDQVVHEKLHLTADQEQRISTLESKFAEQRNARETEMLSANHDLAAAIMADHTYGPRAKQAIERFHVAMAALQEETIIHVLAMRAVLTPEQAQRFDRTVAEVLTSDQP